MAVRNMSVLAGRRRQPKVKGLSEAVIQKAILDWLKAKRYTAWRNYVGPILRGAGIPCPNPMAGMPDICGVLKSKPGHFFGIEVKKKGEGLKPKQIIWHANLKAAGVFVLIAYDLQEVIDFMDLHDS